MNRECPKCKFCSAAFDLSDRLPQMISRCGHSICKACIERLAPGVISKCVECNIEINFENHRERFPPNHGLISIIRAEIEKARASRSFSDCRVHGANSFAVCLDPCQKKVCCECGLFGEHRNHLMVGEEEFYQAAQEKQENLRKCFDGLSQLESYVKNKFLKSKILSLIEKNKLSLSSELLNAFNSIMRALVAEKDRLVSETEAYFSDLNKQVASKFESSFGFFPQIAKWKSEVEGFLREGSEFESSFDFKLKLVVSEGVKRLCNEGKSFSSRIASGIEGLETFVEESSQDLKVRNLLSSPVQFFTIVFPQLESDSFLYNLDSLNGSGNFDHLENLPDVTGPKILSAGRATLFGKSENSSELQRLARPDLPGGQRRASPLGGSNYWSGHTGVRKIEPAPQSSSDRKTQPEISQGSGGVPRLQALKTSLANSFGYLPSTGAPLRRDQARSANNLQVLTEPSEEKVRPGETSILTSQGPTRPTPPAPRSRNQSKSRTPSQKPIDSSQAPRRLSGRSDMGGSRGGRPVLNQAASDLARNTLTTLDLSSCEVTDNDLTQFFDKFPTASNLKAIKLSKNRLTDAGIIALSNALSGSNVQSLDLSSNLATSEALPHLLHLASINRRLLSIAYKRNACEAKSKTKILADFKAYGVALEL